MGDMLLNEINHENKLWLLGTPQEKSIFSTETNAQRDKKGSI